MASYLLRSLLMIFFSKEDITPNLASQVAQRQENWRSLTGQTIWQVDLAAGFDDNLNGAPEQDLITLTPSGGQFC